jgi:hypothetical protein
MSAYLAEYQCKVLPAVRSVSQRFPTALVSITPLTTTLLPSRHPILLMATIHGHSVAQHPASKSHNIPGSRMGFHLAPVVSAYFFWFFLLLELWCSFMHDPPADTPERTPKGRPILQYLFACSEFLPAPAANHTHCLSTKLPNFIAYALHHIKLHQSVNYAALALLQRLKAHFPTACGSSDRRFFAIALPFPLAGQPRIRSVWRSFM